MIARATCAALALVAGSLVMRPAAAQPIPEPAAPSPSSITPPPEPPAPPAATPPPWAAPQPSPPWGAPPPWAAPQPPPPWFVPQQAPYGYAPIPLIWRDGGWYTMDEKPEPARILTTRDPLLPGGVTLASAGVLSVAIGIGVLVSAGSSIKVCGLSGCLGLPDSRAQNSGVAAIAGGLGAAVFGGAVALAGARGPHRERKSESTMMTGMIFTVLGTSAAIAGVAHAASVYPNRVHHPDETLADGYYYGPSQDGVAPIALGLVSLGCLALGIPLWAVGARSRHRHRSAAVDASTLDLLPFAGGASLRWTR